MTPLAPALNAVIVRDLATLLGGRQTERIEETWQAMWWSIEGNTSPLRRRAPRGWPPALRRNLPFSGTAPPGAPQEPICSASRGRYTGTTHAMPRGSAREDAPMPKDLRWAG